MHGPHRIRPNGLHLGDCVLHEQIVILLPAFEVLSKE
jgi:hypothetical protein